jgi:iron complex outermembrane receptor protein
LALVAAVGFPLLITASAYAQDAPRPTTAASPPTAIPELGPPPTGPVPPPVSAGEATTEAVVVTGSYIPTAEEVTASPLDTLTTAEIARAGTPDVLQTLQKRNPDFVGAGNIGATNAGTAQGGTLGGAIIQLRGLPTLVLYEGRRLTESAAIASGGAQFVDVNLFPASLISRIEILKDGASALYGSEAVGGVVNIFTRDDYQGMEIGARYGFSVESGVAERSAYVIAGTGNETTHVTVGLQYYEIDALFQRERGYSSPPRSLFAGTTTTFAGVGRDAVVLAPNGNPANRDYLLVGIDPQDPFGTAGFNSPFNAGVTPGSIAPPPQDPDGPTITVGGVIVAGALPAPPSPGQFAQLADAIGPQPYFQTTSAFLQTFNLSLFPTNTQDQNRTNVIGSFTHQFFGKQLEFFGDFLYTHNHNSSALNAQPIGNNTGVIILGSQRVNPEFNVTATQPFGIILPTGTPNTPLIAENRGAPAPFNPFQLSLDNRTLAGRNRLIAGNRFLPFPRVFTNDTHFYRWLGGLRSQFHENWTAESAIYYSNYSIEFVNAGLIRGDQLNAMIAGTAVDFNGAPIPALDFFARNPIGTGPGQVSLQQFQTMFGKTIRTLHTHQTAFDARITGFPFRLPGGQVGVSFGGEYRTEGFKVDASPEVFLGSVPILEINRNRGIYSGFVEVSVPIIGRDMNVPFVHSLELNAAFRHDHYEGIEEDANVPKFTLRYQPIKDLTVRATYSNSFVAPNLYQLFGPVNQGFTPPVSLSPGPGLPPVPQDQGQLRSGSNPGLLPSKAESYTAGIVWSPSFVPGLTITADFFKNWQKDIVGTVGAAAIIPSVNNLGPASPYANLVAFQNFPGLPGSVPITAPFQLAGNMIAVFAQDPLLNLGLQRVQGFDLTARYNLDLQRFGQLELGASSVIFTNNDLKTTAFDDYYNVLGLIFAEFGGANPDYKLTFLAEYRWQGLTLSLNANYIPEMGNAVGRDPETEDQSTFLRVEDYITVDGRLSYAFKGRTTAGAVVEDNKGGKNALGGKGGGGGVAGAEVMSPMQKILDGTRITVGCNNIFDEDPRLVIGATSATSLATYDPYGRFVYFELSKKF